MERTGGPHGSEHQHPLVPSHLARERLGLCEIESLRPYEQPDPTKVDKIRRSILASGTLINPIIVDPERGILVDGHHRVQAFKDLGFHFIPSFSVDYLSEGVTVRGWTRATNAPSDVVRRAFEESPGRAGTWEVHAIDSANQAVAHLEFETALEGAQNLHRLNRDFEAKGHTVELRVSRDQLQHNLIYSYIRPIVGKNEVLDIIDRRQVFPYEVNRHLVANRPLGMRVPLSSAVDPTRFNVFLTTLTERNDLISIASGFEEEGRLYEESITVFVPRRSDP